VRRYALPSECSPDPAKKVRGIVSRASLHGCESRRVNPAVGGLIKFPVSLALPTDALDQRREIGRTHGLNPIAWLTSQLTPGEPAAPLGRHPKLGSSRSMYFPLTPRSSVGMLSSPLPAGRGAGVRANLSGVVSSRFDRLDSASPQLGWGS